MNSFLFESISDLYGKEKNSFHDICIVVPNKRSGVFIRKYLAELIDNHIFLPQITSINDLVKATAEIAIADTFILVYKLYEVYKKHINTKETFDEFYCWGEMLLNDFDDIDKYYVDVQIFFSNIESLKEIDDRFHYLTDDQLEVIKQFWGTLLADKQSEEQLAFHEIWSKGLHYRHGDFVPGSGGHFRGWILGGPCSGRVSLSWSRSSWRSFSGCVWRAMTISRPSVVGRWTSIICTAANFSSTARGVRPLAVRRSRALSVTCRQ